MVIYPTTLRLKGHLNTMNINILATCGCLRFYKSILSGVIVIGDMEHVMPLPSKGHISVWKDNDLKFIDPW